jgi:hypothetical protein
MYMKDGKLYRVPEIKDRDTKENKDIREWFGLPRRRADEAAR